MPCCFYWALASASSSSLLTRPGPFILDTFCSISRLLTHHGRPIAQGVKRGGEPRRVRVFAPRARKRRRGGNERRRGCFYPCLFGQTWISLRNGLPLVSATQSGYIYTLRREFNLPKHRETKGTQFSFLRRLRVEGNILIWQ